MAAKLYHYKLPQSLLNIKDNIVLKMQCIILFKKNYVNLFSQKYNNEISKPEKTKTTN